MNKFENVDVLASLQQIMQQNTAAFQSDFDIDKKILTQAAKSKNAEDKVLFMVFPSQWNALSTGTGRVSARNAGA